MEDLIWLAEELWIEDRPVSKPRNRTAHFIHVSWNDYHYVAKEIQKYHAGLLTRKKFTLHVNIDMNKEFSDYIMWYRPAKRVTIIFRQGVDGNILKLNYVRVEFREWHGEKGYLEIDIICL